MTTEKPPREWHYITTKFADVEFISDNVLAAEAFERMATRQKQEPIVTVLIEKQAYEKLQAELAAAYKNRKYNQCEDYLQGLEAHVEKITAERDEWSDKYQKLISYMPKVPTQPYEKEMAQEIDQLRSSLREAVVALEVSRLQNYGIRNSWAGMWEVCPNEKCVRKGSWPKDGQAQLYAFGGNWLGDEHGCPECKLTDALTKLKKDHPWIGEG